MKKFFAQTIFWLHFLFVLFWYGLFFIPTSWWLAKVTFHFYLTLFVIAQQFVWGVMITPWTGKYRMVCFFTTVTQFLRGQKISDPKNYEHSFFQELFGRRGLAISHRKTTLLTITTLTIVAIQFFFFNG